MRQLQADWARRDTHQTCHAFGTVNDGQVLGEDVVCRGWWDTQTSNGARIAERLGIVSFEEQPECRTVAVSRSEREEVTQ